MASSYHELYRRLMSEREVKVSRQLIANSMSRGADCSVRVSPVCKLRSWIDTFLLTLRTAVSSVSLHIL